MFMVVNKDKIISYLVSLSTVVVLFVMSSAITQKNDQVLHASVNAIINNEIVNEIENSANSNKTSRNEYNTIGEN